LPDYVSSFNIWDREVVRRTLKRMEDVTGRGWLGAIGKELHFSGWTLYGVFADELEQAKNVAVTSDSLCHSDCDTVHLTPEGAAALLSSVGSQDVAYMIGGEVEHTSIGATNRPRAAVRVLRLAGAPTGRAVRPTWLDPAPETDGGLQSLPEARQSQQRRLGCARRVVCGYAEAVRSGHRDDRESEPVGEA
jgi:hypothetical protein